MMTSASLSGRPGADARLGKLTLSVTNSLANSADLELDWALDSGPGLGPAIRLSWVIARQFLQVACEEFHEVGGKCRPRQLRTRAQWWVPAGEDRSAAVR